MENIVCTLIECKKIITEKPHKEMYPDKRSPVVLRNDFKCKSEDGRYIFSVFMRKSIEMESIFSIGLKIDSIIQNDGNKENIDMIIFRCNHKQEHTNHIANNERFNDYHIHVLEDFQFLQRNDKQLDAKPTNAYNNYYAALYHFLITCNISGYENYFPEARQLSLKECD